MGEPRLFRYKPALLARPVTIEVHPDHIACAGDWTMALADITEAAFVNHVIRKNRMLRLDLYAGDLRRSIGYTGGRADYRHDPDAQEHLRAVAAVLNALAATRPDRKIALGVIRGGRWGMFIIGLCFTLFGVGLGAAALASGVSGDRLIAGTIPTVLLAVMGATLIYGNWPWRARPRIAPAALAKTILAMTTPDETPV